MEAERQRQQRNKGAREGEEVHLYSRHMHRNTEEHCSTFARLTFNQRHSGSRGSTRQESILKAEGWSTLGRRPSPWDNR
jgi:hypothetical protein